MYEVNISDIHINTKNNSEYKLITLGQCEFKEIDILLTKIKKIETVRYNALLKEWEDIRYIKHNLRILKDNSIVGVDETYYNDIILSKCTTNFAKTLYIIGEVMESRKEPVISYSDIYLDYRIRELINNGKLEYKGKIINPRDYEIKLKLI